MKVKEFIEVLKALPQTADIVVWNGLVEDFMPLHKRECCETVVLYKESVKHVYNSLLYEEFVRTKSFETQLKRKASLLKQAKQIAKGRPYSTPNQFVDTKDYSKWYNKKTKKIVALTPSLTGKTYSDRLGAINY